MNAVTVLDVGHGNCAIVRSGEALAVVDAPIGSLLLDTLKDMGVSRIDAAFISHSDKDHLAGIVSLLTSDEIEVVRLYVNPDAGKNSAIWTSLIAAVSVAQKKGTCAVSNSLSSANPGSVALGELNIRVAAPSAALALRGVGGRLESGAVVTPNSLSAVLSVEAAGVPGVLLAGDLDEIGLADAVDHAAPLKANVLVFPHHGGSPGGDAVSFVDQLISAVEPKTVIFSNGRNRYDLPLQSVIEAVAAAGCGIACTQLPSSCNASAVLPMDHLEEVRAHGRRSGHSCAGSMTFDFGDGISRLGDNEARFAAFVDTVVPTPMCRKQAATAPSPAATGSGAPSPPST